MRRGSPSVAAERRHRQAHEVARVLSWRSRGASVRRGVAGASATHVSDRPHLTLVPGPTRAADGAAPSRAPARGLDQVPTIDPDRLAVRRVESPAEARDGQSREGFAAEAAAVARHCRPGWVVPNRE